MQKLPALDETIRIVVVDDHPIIREGLVSILGREADMAIVGIGGTARDAVELAEQHLPHVMLLDVNMPGSGLSALTQLTAAFPAIAVIILTVKEDPDTVGTAIKSGARGYVLKGISGRELADVVRIIRRGDPYITPILAARLLMDEVAPPQSAAASAAPSSQPPGKADADGPLSNLTVREEQILRHLAGGISNKQIANELALSESTVKHYMTNLMQKLQVRNRVEAALIAQRRMKPEDPPR
jgi:two-component system, NarL family, nitrate/nitrite response regulator NarL